MHISWNRPSAITWSLIGSPTNNPAFVTSSDYLNDGKVSTPTRISWYTGAQTTAGSVTIYANFASSISFNLGQVGVLALLMPKTTYAIPAGVSIIVSFNDLSGIPIAVTASATTTTFNNGATGAIVIVPNNTGNLTITEVSVKIFNDKNGATWATAGQNFDIGEIWFGTLKEFKNVGDPQSDIASGVTQRRSHNNNPWPLMGANPYKTWTINIAPMNDTTSFNSSSADSWDSVRYSLSQATSALILPRLYVPGSSSVTDTNYQQFAMFGRPDSIGPLKAVKNSNLWTSSMVFSESPP